MIKWFLNLFPYVKDLRKQIEFRDDCIKRAMLDIMDLVGKDEMKKITASCKWKFYRDLEENIWMGKYSDECGRAEGLYEAMTQIIQDDKTN